MIYKILIGVVFIAELIITFTLIRALLKLDKTILALDETLQEAKPGITDISVLAKKISSQLVVFAYDFKYKLKDIQENMTLKFLNRLLIAMVFFKINSKTINKIRKSKWAKRISTGFAILENMV